MPPDAAAVAAQLPKTRLRPPWPELIVATLLLIASAGPLAYDLYKAHGLLAPGGAMIGRDFVNCWAGAKLTLLGEAGHIWAPDYIRWVRGLTGLPLGTHNFSYPPPLLLFIWPLAFLPYMPALLVWLAATGAAYLVAARRYLDRASLPWWAAALTPAVLINIWAGHHGFVLAALWLGAFASIEERPALAGILIGLLTLKPHMGVLIPLVLLIRRQWAVIAVAAGATLALILASAAVFGWQPWVDYWTWTVRLQASMLVAPNPLFFDLMPTGYVSMWVASKMFAAAVATQLIVGAAAVAITVRSALSRMNWRDLGLVTATATFLVLPYAFNYDMTVVGVAAAILLFGNRKRLHWAGRILALVAFGAPILVAGANYERIPVLPFLLLAFLWVQARAYAPPQERPRSAPAFA